MHVGPPLATVACAEPNVLSCLGQVKERQERSRDRPAHRAIHPMHLAFRCELEATAKKRPTALTASAAGSRKQSGRTEMQTGTLWFRSTGAISA